MRVLLVDDDADLLDVTSYALRREGFTVTVAADGRQALRRWESDRPDVVVLDVGLPHLNGFEVCRRLREQGTTPVIFLTGAAADEQVVRGFQLGADDYVTKPFSAKQLAMRVRAVHRRAAPSGHPEPEPDREVRAGGLVLDLESHEVGWGDRRVRLTPIECRLLHLLALNAGRVVPSGRLVEYAWRYQESDVTLLKAHLSHLRTKLGLARGSGAEIRGIPGVGYQLVRAPAAG